MLMASMYQSTIFGASARPLPPSKRRSHGHYRFIHSRSASWSIGKVSSSFVSTFTAAKSRLTLRL